MAAASRLQVARGVTVTVGTGGRAAHGGRSAAAHRRKLGRWRRFTVARRWALRVFAPVGFAHYKAWIREFKSSP